MSNGKDRVFLKLVPNDPLYDLIRLGVDIACYFVEDQNLPRA